MDRIPVGVPSVFGPLVRQFNVLPPQLLFNITGAAVGDTFDPRFTDSATITYSACFAVFSYDLVWRWPCDDCRAMWFRLEGP